jgi:hypothetical protein
MAYVLRRSNVAIDSKNHAAVMQHARNSAAVAGRLVGGDESGTRCARRVSSSGAKKP